MKVTAGVFALFFSVIFAFAQDASWETVSVPGICTFQIPLTIEVQAGSYKEVADRLKKSVLEIDESPYHVVAQQKGLNAKEPAAFKLYCRIIVDTEKGALGDHPKLGEPLALSALQLRELDTELKQQLQQTAALMTSKGMKMTVLTQQPVKIVRVNGVDALMKTHTRSMNDAPPVLVRMYMIQNNDCLHRITISYRESEGSLWAIDFTKVIDTFK
jgi:hypothetical protein